MVGSIGIVGYGSFGSLLETLIQRFAPEVGIKIHSSRFAPDDKKFFSLEDVAECDAVVLCVPIHAFEATLKKVLPHLGAHTVIVDVATVKMYTVEVLKRLAGERQWVATHPMWGPESYAKTEGDIRGYRVVVAGSTLEPARKSTLLAFLRTCGFDVVEMSAEGHDKHLAETLFLTHFVGQAVSRGDFDRTQIDTVSFGYLMDATESVKHDTALFKDVYRYNPYCEEVLARFEAAEAEVHALLKEGE